MANYGRINANNAVPTINRLQMWAVQDLQKEVEGKQMAMMVEVDHLAARVDAVLYHLGVIVALTDGMIQWFASRGQAVPMTGPDEMTDARHETNAVFYDMVRLQDRITTLPTRLLDYHDMPYSMNDMAKRMEQGQELKPFFEKVKDEFLRYWNASGKKLRAYRDISTHHHPIFDQSRFDHKTGRIHIPVPDNPEAKSWKKLTFNQDMNGADLAFEYAGQLLDFCEYVLQKLATEVIPNDSHAWKGGRVLVSEGPWPGGGLKIKLSGRGDAREEEEEGN